MAPKHKQAKAAREVIDPDGDVVLRLRRAKSKSETTASGQDHNGTSNGTTENANGSNGNGSSPVNGGTDTKVAMETVELVVSSKMLCLVSPVFRTLLKGPFRESSEFASKRKRANSTGDDDLYILDLPEDDASAMALLMRLIHFRLGDTSAPDGDGVHSGLPNPELLEHLAFLCDKYSCASALQGVSSSWARDNMDRIEMADEANKAAGGPVEASESNAKDWCRLLVFAFVADQPFVYTNICWKLILRYKTNSAGSVADTKSSGESLDINMLADHPLLPKDLTGVFETRRLESCTRFHKELMSVLELDWNTDFDLGSCYCRSSTLGGYWDDITKAGLVSLDLTYSRFSIQMLMDGLNKLSMLPSSRTTSCSSDFCRRKQAIPDPTKDLVAKKTVVLGEKDGAVCLDCFRTGGRTHKEGKCRVPHP